MITGMEFTNNLGDVFKIGVEKGIITLSIKNKAEIEANVYSLCVFHLHEPRDIEAFKSIIDSIGREGD